MSTFTAVEKSIARAKRFVFVSASSLRKQKRNANRNLRHSLKNRVRECVSSNDFDDTTPHKLPRMTSHDIS